MGFGFLKRHGARPDKDRNGARAAVPPAAPGNPPADSIRVYCMGPSQEMRYTVELLTAKGLAFEEIDVSADPGLQSWVKQKTGSHEYPQVFLGREPLGDFGTLRKLDLQGNLDRVLAGLPPLDLQAEEPGTAEGGSELEQVRARLRRGDVLSLTTPEGETFDTWAEIYANPPQIYYRGEPRPIEALDEIAAEIVELLSDPRCEVEWSAGG